MSRPRGGWKAPRVGGWKALPDVENCVARARWYKKGDPDPRWITEGAIHVQTSITFDAVLYRFDFDIDIRLKKLTVTQILRHFICSKIPMVAHTQLKRARLLKLQEYEIPFCTRSIHHGHHGGPRFWRFSARVDLRNLDLLPGPFQGG